MLTIIHTTPVPNLNPIFIGCLTPHRALSGSMTNCRQAACLYIVLHVTLYILSHDRRFVCENPEAAPGGPLSVLNPVGHII